MFNLGKNNPSKLSCYFEFFDRKFGFEAGWLPERPNISFVISRVLKRIYLC